ncbi:uncharacterized protein LOC121735672 [Aricia agestis]|uniref:uncharacterized protein LOC121735672 n=1 Tax=Aricia agestis TaxID=91739 RepID=UPI001C209234|nr:uncharacterized protein LOC121735672 [Aricia agestis]
MSLRPCVMTPSRYSTVPNRTRIERCDWGWSQARSEGGVTGDMTPPQNLRYTLYTGSAKHAGNKQADVLMTGQRTSTSSPLPPLPPPPAPRLQRSRGRTTQVSPLAQRSKNKGKKEAPAKECPSSEKDRNCDDEGFIRVEKKKKKPVVRNHRGTAPEGSKQLLRRETPATPLYVSRLHWSTTVEFLCCKLIAAETSGEQPEAPGALLPGRARAMGSGFPNPPPNPRLRRELAFVYSAPAPSAPSLNGICGHVRFSFPFGSLFLQDDGLAEVGYSVISLARPNHSCHYGRETEVVSDGCAEHRSLLRPCWAVLERVLRCVVSVIAVVALRCRFSSRAMQVMADFSL